MNIVLVTIWTAVAIGPGGSMQHIYDYKTRAACEETLREAMQKSLQVRCMKTEQLVPKSYFDGLR